MEKTTIKDLEAIRFSANTNSPKTATIFLHGAGASMNDLVPLKDYIENLQKDDLYFLNAPFTMMPNYPMYIWFNVGELVQKMADHGFDEDIVKTFVPTKINEGRKYLYEAMDVLEKKYETINIVGFSQGGMMAIDYALKSSKVKKVALLSTSICDYPNLVKKIENADRSLEIFQSHGDKDDILPLEYGQYLYNTLTDNNFKVTFYEFNGGHEIPLEILKKMDIFF